MPWVLRMSRPGQYVISPCGGGQAVEKNNKQMQEVEMRER
jgi:hypothetical protein